MGRNTVGWGRPDFISQNYIYNEASYTMKERWLIIGTDERMKLLAKQLTSKERTIYYKCTTKWDESLNKAILEFHPTIIVLPIQPLKIEVDELYGIRSAQIFAGRIDEHWQKHLQDVKPIYYLQNEAFIWKNAALTAEGFLAHLFVQRVSVQNKKIVITGFGRVAKMLALFLSRLKANVQIAVRSEAQCAEANAYGYEGMLLEADVPCTADLIINTIPTQWLSKEYESWLSCPIYDVASAPGCLNNLVLSQYELLPALPGKYFPQAAANILYETMLDLGRKDKSA